jgi:hypothetical protein
MALIGLSVKLGGGLLGAILAVAVLGYPIAVVVSAAVTDRFSDAALRAASPGLQGSVVVVLAIGLLSPVLLVVSIVVQ